MSIKKKIFIITFSKAREEVPASVCFKVITDGAGSAADEISLDFAEVVGRVLPGREGGRLNKILFSAIGLDLGGFTPP
jgi:hypothetical protein